jgi:hypothetical protein
MIELHHEDLHNLCFLTNIIRMTKWRRMRWAGHVESMGEKRNTYRILVNITIKPKAKRGVYAVAILLPFILQELRNFNTSSISLKFLLTYRTLYYMLLLSLPSQ